jgi:hypothetical protein
MKLLDLLFLFLRPAVEGQDDPTADPLADSPADPNDPAPDLEVEIPEGETPTAGSPEADAALIEIRAEKARGDRLERELAELKTSRPSAPRDEQFEHEESRLKDPKIEPLEKWQIEANRELRRGRSEAQFALAQAHDVADRTAFSALAVTSPAIYKRYAPKVEEELTKLRSQGRNLQRETLLDLLIGRDARTGVLTKKKAAAKADDAPAAAAAVNRGRLPGARSDVGGKGGSMTNKQKLEKKLEGVQI